MLDFHGTFRVLLHASNLRHGTDGFTSPPKEGVLRIFFTRKIRRLRPGLNPRTWVLKASTLPLDHGSRLLGDLVEIRAELGILQKRYLFLGESNRDTFFAQLFT
jgi:hypothetical protein